MSDCPFTSRNPDMLEEVSSYVEEHCSELVSGFTQLGNKSPQLDLLRGRLKDEIDDLNPDVKEIFEANVYKLQNNYLFIGYTYEELNLNESWADVRRINDRIDSDPMYMPNFLELATKIKEVETLINNSGDYKEDLEKLKKIKKTFALLNPLTQSIKILVERLTELYKEYKKLTKEQTGFVATGRNQGVLENLANTFNDENARKRARQGGAVIKESRSPGGQFDNVDKAIYQEQCFLLSQLKSLVALKRKNHRPRLPYVLANSPVKGTSEENGTGQKN